MNRTTVVTILGESYPIRSDADADYLHKLAQYVEERIEGITSKNKLPQQLKGEVLAALLIADELFAARARHQETDSKVRKLVEELEAHVQ